MKRVRILLTDGRSIVRELPLGGYDAMIQNLRTTTGHGALEWDDPFQVVRVAQIVDVQDADFIVEDIRQNTIPIYECGSIRQHCN